MVTRKKGRPVFCLALPQEIIDLLKAKAEEEFGPAAPFGGGRAAGASRLVRRWVYQGLGLEQPPEWGELDTPAATYQRARRARLAAEEAAKREEEP